MIDSARRSSSGGERVKYPAFVEVVVTDVEVAHLGMATDALAVGVDNFLVRPARIRRHLPRKLHHDDKA